MRYLCELTCPFRMKTLTFFFLLFPGLCSQVAFAQIETETAPVVTITSPTLQQQIDEILSLASTWNDHWLIKKSRFSNFQTQLKDTLSVLHQDLRNLQNTQAALEKQLADTGELLSNSESSNQKLNKEKNSMSVLGLMVNKKAFQVAVAGLLLLLLATTGFFFFQYRTRNDITAKVRKTLTETQEEFDQYKKRAIEREQKLKRELQDELNKRSS